MNIDAAHFLYHLFLFIFATDIGNFIQRHFAIIAFYALLGLLLLLAPCR